MDRVMISYNVPNFVTVNLMAWFGIMLFFLLYQFVAKRGAKNGAPTTAGADEIEGLGGY